MSLLRRLRQIIQNAARIARELTESDEPEMVDALDVEFLPPNDYALPVPKFSSVIAPVRVTGTRGTFSMWVMLGPESQLVGYAGKKEEAVIVVAGLLLDELRKDLLPTEALR